MTVTDPYLLGIDGGTESLCAAQTEKVLATGDAAVRVNNGGNGPVSAEWMIPN